jgi:outer membrane protein TolC
VAEEAATNGALAYVRALRADAQLAARAADSTLAFHLLGIAQDQLTAGVGVALDVTRAQSQLATVRAQLIAARNDRDRSRLDLIRALGLPADARVTLTASLGGARGEPVATEQEAIARALSARPDLRAAAEQVRALERQIQAVRAERLPSVSAFGDDGVIAKNSNGNYLNTYTWGIQLSVPIFEGFRREGRVEEQELVRREAEVRLRDLREQASTEVRQSLLDIASTREQVDASRERLRLAELELTQARDRFRAGVAGNADVITASLSLNSARTQLNDALTSFQLARVGLARAQGAVAQLR